MCNISNIRNIFNTYKKPIVTSMLATISVTCIYTQMKNYTIKDNEFKKRMNEIKQLQNESYMTHEIADMILEDAS